MLVNGSAMLLVGKENTPDRGRVRDSIILEGCVATTLPSRQIKLQHDALIPKLTPVVFLHGFVDGTIQSLLSPRNRAHGL